MISKVLLLSYDYIGHLLFWSNLGMPTHFRQNPIEVLLIYKKLTLFLNSFLRYYYQTF